jgi:hypothetical protein
MANEEHVALLLGRTTVSWVARLFGKTAVSWNAWRKENPGTRPDLREANLSGAKSGWQT